VPEVVEETLLCLVEVLCLRNRELVLAGLGPFVALPATAPFPSVMTLFPPVFVPFTADNWVVKSLVESPEMLLCKSSKLGEGRKSKEAAGF
jgi:hypothetical protein